MKNKKSYLQLNAFCQQNPDTSFQKKIEVENTVTFETEDTVFKNKDSLLKTDEYIFDYDFDIEKEKAEKNFLKVKFFRCFHLLLQGQPNSFYDFKAADSIVFKKSTAYGIKLKLPTAATAYLYYPNTTILPIRAEIYLTPNNETTTKAKLKLEETMQLLNTSTLFKSFTYKKTSSSTTDYYTYYLNGEKKFFLAHVKNEKLNQAYIYLLIEKTQ